MPILKFEPEVICPDGPSPATGEGDGEGVDAPAATLGAYLCAVRTMLCIVRIQHCKRQKGVRQGGIRPP